MSRAETREGSSDGTGLGDHRFLAGLLKATADQVSLTTATRLLQTSPAIATRYSPQPLVLWRQWIHDHIQELAAALLAGQPGMFAERVEWARHGFAVRSAPEEDMVSALLMLASVLDHEVPDADRGTVQAYFRAALEGLGPPQPQAAAPLSAATPHGRLAAHYLLAVLQGDRRQAINIVLDAVKSRSISARDAYLKVLAAAQTEIGRMWHEGEITIPEEHSATATTQVAMSLVADHFERLPPNGRTVVTACIERNAHEIGVRMLADLFEAAGWRSVYLGPNVPREDLTSAVEIFEADLLAISACLRPHIDHVREAIEHLRATPLAKPVKILVGGQAFANTGDLWKSIGADGFATSADDAVDLGNRLFGLATPAHAATAAGN